MNIGLHLKPQIRIYAAFFIYSLALGGIYPRLGDIQIAMGITEGVLGLALIGLGSGTLLSLTFASPLLDRLGYKSTMIFGIVLLASSMAIATFMPGPLFLFVMLFVSGLVIGAIEVVINVEADRVEHLVDRRIMNRCHAFWSFGFFGAGFVGALAKQAGISPQIHLVGMVPLIFFATILFLGRLSPAAARAKVENEVAPKFAVPTLGIMALVAFTLSGTLLEGAAADWSVIFMRDIFEVAPFINGLAFAVGALGQAVARFFADGIISRFGQIRVARILVLTLGVGAILVTTAQHPMIALIGFALMGIGSSALFPLAISAAAQRTDRPAAINVAALAQTAFAAFLLGPPLLGYVAEHFGIRVSFAVCLPFIVMSWFAIRALNPSAAASMREATNG